MFTQLPFISSEQIQQCFVYLNDVIRKRAMGVLYGQQGVGKTRVLQHFIACESVSAHRNTMLLADLLPSMYKAYNDPSKQGSPMTRNLFEQLAHHVQHLYPVQRHTQGTDPSQSKASSLYRVIESACRTYPIRAVIIDNAQYLDTIALEWLMSIRTKSVQRVAILFCIRLEAKEDASVAFRRTIQAVPSADQQLLAPYTLALPTKTQFIGETFQSLLKAMNLRLVKKFQEDATYGTFLSATLWELTHGRWTALDTVMRCFADASTHTDHGNVITVKTVATVYQQITGNVLDTTILKG